MIERLVESGLPSHMRVRRRIFIYKLLHNWIRHHLPSRFNRYQRPLSEVASSSRSCHGNDVTWQEIGRMCGSVCSCPHSGSLNAVPPFGCVPPPWSTWCSCQIHCLRLLMLASWSHGCRDLHGQSRLIYYVLTNLIDADFLWKVCLLLPPPLSCFLLVLYQTFFQSHLCMCSHNYHKQFCTHNVRDFFLLLFILQMHQ